jgi:hypothetical protein
MRPVLICLSLCIGMAGCAQEKPRDQIQAHLLQMFKGEDIEAYVNGEWIFVPDNTRKIKGTVIHQAGCPEGVRVQLEICFHTGTGRTFIESYPGVGATKEKAITDAVSEFAHDPFPTLVEVFLPKNDFGRSRFRWQVGGEEKWVSKGPGSVRCSQIGDVAQSHEWFQLFQEKLKTRKLPKGTHWVRLEYSQSQNQMLTCKVLLDNEPWKEMETEMAAFPWRGSNQFYSVREFLVFEDE